jgi:hypothetical protein
VGVRDIVCTVTECGLLVKVDGGDRRKWSEMRCNYMGDGTATMGILEVKVRKAAEPFRPHWHATTW